MILQILLTIFRKKRQFLRRKLLLIIQRKKSRVSLQAPSVPQRSSHRWAISPSMIWGKVFMTRWQDYSLEEQISFASKRVRIFCRRNMHLPHVRIYLPREKDK